MTDSGILAYVQEIIPAHMEPVQVYTKDFNGGGIKEAIVICYSDINNNPELPGSCILYVKSNIKPEDSVSDRVYDHYWIDLPRQFDDNFGYDPLDAYIADTNGDGRLELVVVMGKLYYLRPVVFSWVNDVLTMVWYSTRDFYLADLTVMDADGDGIDEIIIEEAVNGEELDIIAMSISSPHVFAGYCYKWDGTSYVVNTHPISTPDRKAFNTAVYFLLNLWKGNYEGAAKLAHLPAFLGLNALAGNVDQLFKAFVDQGIRPALLNNLQQDLLTIGEYQSSYACSFIGPEQSFFLGLSAKNGEPKVVSVEVIPQDPTDLVKKFCAAVQDGNKDEVIKYCRENLRGDTITSIMDHLKSDAQAGGSLQFEVKYPGEHKSVIYCFHADDTTLSWYAKPNRIMVFVLELTDTGWKIAFVKYLGNVLPPKISWQCSLNPQPEDDSIYYVYRMQFERPTYIVVRMCSKNPEHCAQLDFENCRQVDVYDFYWGISLSFYRQNEVEKIGGFVSTDIAELEVAQISEVAYQFIVTLR